MTKFKKIVSSPVFSVAALLAAAGLLVFSSISGARAALNIRSSIYDARVQMYDIGVSLLENGNKVAYRDYITKQADGSWNETPGEDHVGILCKNLLGEDKNLKLGKEYNEKLSVTNSGVINEFVRVTVYKYWLDPEGNKTQELDPSKINLHFTPGSAWEIDESASTDERTVLYYKSLLNAGESTPIFTDTLMIDSSTLDIWKSGKEEVKVVKDDKVTTTHYTYAYNGYQFVIEAHVDAVQEHNAKDAVKSAWGQNVDINGTSLKLNKEQ